LNLFIGLIIAKIGRMEGKEGLFYGMLDERKEAVYEITQVG